MLIEVDKLRHGASFEIIDIDIFDGRGRRVQYMVSRNVIDVLKDIFGNSEFEGEMAYAPVRFWTKGHGGEQVIGDMHTARWWWNEQVSFDIPSRCAR